MHRIFLAVFAFGLLFPQLRAQTHLTGKIVDEKSGSPLALVSISAIPHGKETYSDSKGNFVLEIPAQSDSVLVSHIGFQEFYFSLRALKNSQTPQGITFSEGELLIRLQSNSLPVQHIQSKLFQDGPNAIKHLTKKDLQVLDLASLQSSLNQVPGVQFDARGNGGSLRLSVRGSLLRSPFGVRNLKVYWNQVPLTSPDGSTPLESLEPEFLDNLSIRKGPQGSDFGPGMGGVLLAETGSIPFSTLQANLSAGSFGMTRISLRQALKKGKWSSNLQYVRRRYQGYREQEANRKDQIQLSIKRESAKHRIELNSFYFNGYWELPGALDSANAEEFPRSAVPFSVAAQAAVQRERLFSVLNHRFETTIQKGGRLGIESAVFGDYAPKFNPYGTSPFFQGIKEEAPLRGGFRSVAQASFPSLFKLSFIQQHRIQIGIEAQRQNNSYREFENLAPGYGPLRTKAEIFSSNGLLFVKDQISFSSGFFMDWGLSANRIHYTFKDLFLRKGSDLSGATTYTQFMPAVGLSKQLLQGKISLWTRVAKGFSPPVIWESLLPQGGLSKDLQPGQGWNYEIGLKGATFSSKKAEHRFEFSLYRLELSEDILPRSLPDGSEIWVNTGSVRNQGIEAEWALAKPLSFSFLGKPQGFSYRLWGALQDFKFRDYSVDGGSFAGNHVPGPSLLSMGFSLDAQFFGQFALSFSVTHQGKRWLDNANLQVGNPYTLLDARLSKSFRLLPSLNKGLEVYLGGSNLLNQSYTGFFALNAFRGRYYNPALPFNFYGGLLLRL